MGADPAHYNDDPEMGGVQVELDITCLMNKNPSMALGLF